MARVFELRGQPLRMAQMFLVVCPAFLLFGWGQSNLGGLLTLPDWVKTFPTINTVNASPQTKSRIATVQGTITASFTLGAIFGSLSCLVVGDRLGRRWTIFVGGLLTLVGEVLEASAFALAQFTVGRILVGAGVGYLSVTVPSWQAETSDAKHRGRHVVCCGLFMLFAYALSAWINFGLYKGTTGPITWRLPLSIPFIFSLVCMVSILFLPESPRWLMKVGRCQDATQVLAQLKDMNEDDLEIDREIRGIQLSLDTTAQNASSILKIFRKSEERLFFRFMLCIALQFFQQMSGGNLISVYSPLVFSALNFSSDMSKILTGAALTWKFFCCFVAFIAIDRWGRRAVFMISGGGMGICKLGLAVTTSFSGVRAANIASAFFVFLFNTFIPIGFEGSNFLYCTEVAPVHLRTAMLSISTANHWLWNFIVIMITPVGIETIGGRYYIVYTVICALIPITVYFLFPETMNRSLEQLDLVFREAPSIWSIVSISRKMPQGEVMSDEQIIVASHAAKDPAVFGVAEHEE